MAVKDLKYPMGLEPRTIDWAASGPNGVEPYTYWEVTTDGQWVYASEYGTYTRILNKRGELAIKATPLTDRRAPTGPTEPRLWTLGIVIDLAAEGNDYQPAAKALAVKLAPLPVCLVLHDDGEFGLAATSAWSTPWDIAMAAILCGYFPPYGLALIGDRDVWEAAVGTIGRKAARKVRAALRARLTAEIARNRQALNMIGEWK